MPKNLANMIRLISTKGEKPFMSSLSEELDRRLQKKVKQTYLNISENVYKTETPNIEESVVKNNIVEQLPIKQNKINELISSLQECIRDEKTIIHKFSNGDSVSISHDDSKFLVKLHDSLNSMNQSKMRKLMSENYSEYNKILQFSKKYNERTQK